MRKVIFIWALFVLTVFASGQQVLTGVVAGSGASAPAGEDENLITNGDFSNGTTDWSFGADWSLVSGEAVYTSGAGNLLIQTDADMAGSIAASTDYEISFDITVAGTSYFRFTNEDGSAAYTGYLELTTGSHTIPFTTSGALSTFGIRIQTIGALTIDNLSLVEV